MLKRINDKTLIDPGYIVFVEEVEQDGVNVFNVWLRGISGPFTLSEEEFRTARHENSGKEGDGNG